VGVLLAVDTSGKNGGITLARLPAQQGGALDVLETIPLAGGTFSAQLVPQIADLLARHQQSKADIDAFAVVSGPGSFTGLRVGLAAIKALAEVLQKPIVAVSLLEAISTLSLKSGRTTAALEAGRGDVYVGTYDTREIGSNDSRSREATLVEECLLSREEFVELCRTTAIVTPDATLAELSQRSGGSAEQVSYPDASVIARIGRRKLQAGQTVAPIELDANYIRRSDAEIFAKPK
jgi:tRNA threonylcarbamoyladenosine biosynthesis protein TsaB